MKVAALLLFIFNVIVALAAAAFILRFSVIETAGGGEYLILKAEQAKECETGGGCAVFSQREFFTTLSQALRGRM